MTAMRVKALRQQPDDGAIVVLEDVAGRLGLAFLIPINEANRLARIIGPAECRRTPVYELVCDLAATLDATVAGAVLDCESEGIYATLVLERHGAPIELRCHPPTRSRWRSARNRRFTRRRPRSRRRVRCRALESSTSTSGRSRDGSRACVRTTSAPATRGEGGASSCSSRWPGPWSRASWGCSAARDRGTTECRRTGAPGANSGRLLGRGVDGARRDTQNRRAT
jgi:hypothetical protein